MVSVPLDRSRQIPADLAAVALLVVLTGSAVFVSPLDATPLRPVLGVAFALFAPGYAVVAALFPGQYRQTDDDRGTVRRLAENDSTGAVTGLERLVFSFGASVAVVILTGLALGTSAWGIRRVPVFIALAAITLFALCVATVRRWRIPAHERFRVPFADAAQVARAEVFSPETPVEAVANIALVVAMLLAVTLVGFGAGAQGDSGVTEFYLLAAGPDGEFTASEYPTSFERGERGQFAVGIGNYDRERQNYTVAVLLQRFGPRNETVVARTEVARLAAVVERNQTRRIPHNVTFEATGKGLRLQYLLYTGDPPANPTAGNADKELHLWIDVSTGVNRTNSG